MNDCIIKYTTQDLTNFDLLKDVLSKTRNANVDKPYHQKFSTEQSRIDSFAYWPTTIAQKPIELAKAGFYYFGQQDKVKCFFCNLGIENWEPLDIPIEEHARWFPTCTYIRQLMGIEFIEEMREKFKNIESAFTKNFKHEMTHYFNSSPDIETNTLKNLKNIDFKTNNDINEDDVIARLHLPSIRKIIDLGFKESTVYRAIEEELRKNGENYKNLVDLVSACFKIDEQDKKLEIKMKNLFDLVLFNVSSTIKKYDIYNLFSLMFQVKTKIIRLIPVSYKSNLVFITLNNEDKNKLDDLYKNFNKKIACFENKSFKINITKLNSFNCIDNIINKFYKSKKFFDELLNDNSDVNNKNNDNNNECGVLVQENSINNSLVEEFEKLKNERNCVICLDRYKNIIFLPCAHFASCVECSVSMSNCPICRSKVEATIKTFIS